MKEFVFAIAIVALSVSCELRESKEIKDRARYGDDYGFVTYVNGDPKSLIANATTTTEIGLKASEVDTSKTYLLIHASTFVNQVAAEIGKRQTQSQIEQSNHTTDDNLARPEFQFVQESATSMVLRSISGFEETVDLSFTIAGDELSVASLDGEPATLLHYSERDDIGAYSFLMEVADDVATTAMMWFVIVEATPQQAAEVTDSKYVYLLGKGIVARHPGTELAVANCGADSTLLERGLGNWLTDCSYDGVLGAYYPDQCSSGNLSGLGVRRTQSTLPFADITQNCVLQTAEFIIDNPPSYPAGVTLPVINPRTFEIIAAPVIIFRLRRGNTVDTYAHELGHMFGLGHQFERDEAGNALYPSVMGYDNLMPQAYDQEAVAILYPQ